MRATGHRGDEMPDRPLKILYILGTGRCGSTLLSCLLSRADGLVAPGEIGLIWDRLVTENFVCDCGAPFRTCAFWGDVVRGALPSNGELATARELNRRHWRLTGPRAAPSLLLRRSPDRLGADHARYLEVLSRVYLEIVRLTGCRVLVDASKRPLHASLLEAMPSWDIRCIHLVRDSRAVVFSQLGRTKRSARFLAARWMIVNLLAEAAARRHVTHLRLRYEDLCRDPQGSVARIASFADESLEPIRIQSDRTIQLQPGHGVGGDSVRFRQGTVAISASEAWHTEMNPRERRVVTRMTWPLLARYGYRGALRGGEGAR
jgi:hypothetical protein